MQKVIWEVTGAVRDSCSAGNLPSRPQRQRLLGNHINNCFQNTAGLGADFSSLRAVSSCKALVRGVLIFSFFISLDSNSPWKTY